MAINRFFFQATTTDTLFNSRHNTGWQVFDRELAHEQNPEGVIAFCINRHFAKKISDALNEVKK